VVAQGQAVGAGVEQVPGGPLGDAEARGRVLCIDDDELQVESPAQARQVVGETVPAGFPDHVSEKGEAHSVPSGLWEAAVSSLGEDGVKMLIVGLTDKTVHLRAGKGQAEDEDRTCPAQFGKGPVVVSAALSQPSAEPVKGQEGGDHQVGSRLLGVLRWRRQA
jgi:hypothetical protein